MGTFQKRSSRQYKRKLSAEEKFDKDLKDCMRCKYFWGNDNRCRRSKCYKEKKKPVVEKPVSECEICPYNKGEGYCFPCMKKSLESRGNDEIQMDIKKEETDDEQQNRSNRY